MSALTPKRSWAWRVGMVALVIAVLAAFLGIIAATLARFDIVSKLGGFGMLFNSLFGIVAAGAIAIAAILIGLIGRSGPKKPALIALLIVAAFIGAIASQVATGTGSPMMHDVTTNIEDPPQFAAITLPADNLRGFNTVEEWQAAHRQGYPDMAPVIIEKSPELVLADARALAIDRGWDIVDTNVQTGRMEAVAFASYVRFHDFVVVQVTPIADGSTRVDMRSTSEVGLGDLGYNAKRIEEFLSALQAVA